MASYLKEQKMKLEETKNFLPQFRPALNHDETRAPNLITTILQDNPNGSVLYAATMDERALELTLETMRVHLYSRTAKTVRRKGATSGDELAVIDMLTNCNQDSLLLEVRRLGEDGGCCHTRTNPNDPQSPHRPTCFYRVIGRTVGRTREYTLSFL
jgi:phosphoribosyl-AMP cyclohydrolase